MEAFLDIYPETRERIKSLIDASPNGFVCHIGPNTRSLEQNKKLWAMLNDVSRQVEWYGQRLGPYDWKHMFTAALKKSRSVPGIDGGVVILGQSTSRMNKMEFSELIELMLAFGADHNVRWSDEKTL